jgi:uncharacterized protein (DUF111 family)
MDKFNGAAGFVTADGRLPVPGPVEIRIIEGIDFSMGKRGYPVFSQNDRL